MQHNKGDNKSIIISFPVAPNPLCYYAICAGAFYNLYVIDLPELINKVNKNGLLKLHWVCNSWQVDQPVY
jgi:hypothetical protein